MLFILVREGSNLPNLPRCKTSLSGKIEVLEVSGGEEGVGIVFFNMPYCTSLSAIREKRFATEEI